MATERELLSLRTEELNLGMETMRLENSVAITQHQQKQEAKETEIRRLKEEKEILRMRFEEAQRLREHVETMRRLEMEHELKPEVLEMSRIKLKLAKATENTERLKNENYRHEREQMERMATIEVQRLKQCEESLRRRREQDEHNTRCLMNLGLAATGVGAASGAAAAGLAAGVVVGAATMLAPVSGAVAVISGAGYVYKKATSSSRA